MVKQGMKSVDVISYYDGSTVHIPLDVRKSPSANAQHYYKKYGKAKTAIKEKKIQIQENDEEIVYLESVLGFIDKTESGAHGIIVVAIGG
jgi:predicted ribosome quality control (RQC) complex YloA/Tae2 family protein